MSFFIVAPMKISNLTVENKLQINTGKTEMSSRRVGSMEI
jgi:hypothetical protein